MIRLPQRFTPCPKTTLFRSTFGILGPLTVWSRGNRLAALGEPRQRAVLGTLLIDVNQAVPVDRLIEVVWGERPPSTVRKAIQDRKSTRLNSSHANISYTVFC